VAGACFRLVFVLLARRGSDTIWGDGFFYHESAKFVADGLGWISPADYYEGLRVEAADHPPLYIAYLALWTWFGIRSVQGHILASCLIGLATIVLIGLAGRRIAGPRVGLVASAVALVYPNVWLPDTMLMSESFSLLAVAALTLAIYRFRERPTVWLAAGCGAIVALAALSRVELLALSLVVVTPAILGRRAHPWRTRLLWLGTAAASAVAILTPWVVHNLDRFEQPVYLSNGFEITLSSANCDHTYYGPLIGYWNLLCPVEIYEANGVTHANTDQSQRSELLLDETLDYISEHRDRVPRVVAVRIGRITGVYHPIQQAQLDVFPEMRDRWAAYTALAMWYPLVAFGIGGAVWLRRRRIAVYPLVAPLALVLSVVIVTFATNRYRAPAEASLCLLAAAGLVALWDVVIRLRATSDAPALGHLTPATEIG
jgi:4-amino-4-deoxy-L-arabinose transferase-like glycosyltransferase